MIRVVGVQPPWPPAITGERRGDLLAEFANGQVVASYPAHAQSGDVFFAYYVWGCTGAFYGDPFIYWPTPSPNMNPPGTWAGTHHRRLDGTEGTQARENVWVAGPYTSPPATPEAAALPVQNGHPLFPARRGRLTLPEDARGWSFPISAVTLRGVRAANAASSELGIGVSHLAAPQGDDTRVTQEQWSNSGTPVRISELAGHGTTQVNGRYIWSVTCPSFVTPKAIFVLVGAMWQCSDEIVTYEDDGYEIFERSAELREAPLDVLAASRIHAATDGSASGRGGSVGMMLSGRYFPAGSTVPALTTEVIADVPLPAPAWGYSISEEARHLVQHVWAFVADEADTAQPAAGPATATPSVPAGSYSQPQTVTLSTDRAARIYYTLDGTDPGPGALTAPIPAPIANSGTYRRTSVFYHEPITVGPGQTLKVATIDEWGNVGTQEFQYGTPALVQGSPIDASISLLTGSTAAENFSRMVLPGPLKIWNGTALVDAPLRLFDGSTLS